MAVLLALCLLAGEAGFPNSPFQRAKALSFEDFEKQNYEDAISLLKLVGVITGEDSDFNPDDILQRDEAFNIAGWLLAKDDASKSGSQDNWTSDANEWADGYIAFCEQQGIVAGYGDGQFGPDETVTGGQFMKTLLVALGYDPVKERLQDVGQEWIFNTMKLGNDINAFAGIQDFPYLEPISLEDAVKMALNVSNPTFLQRNMYYNKVNDFFSYLSGEGLTNNLLKGLKAVLDDPSLQQYAQTVEENMDSIIYALIVERHVVDTRSRYVADDTIKGVKSILESGSFKTYSDYAVNFVTVKKNADGTYDLSLTEENKQKCRENGHKPGGQKTENAVASSCTEGGSYDLAVRCQVCGELLESKHVDTAPMGHRYEAIGGYPATCTEPGLTDGQYCPECGTVFVNRQTIPATGHDWGDWTVTVPATAAAEGTETRVCNNDSSHVETRAIPKLSTVAPAPVPPAVTPAPPLPDNPALPAGHTHTPGNAAVENEVAADCRHNGSMDLVVYCEGCGEELSRDTLMTEVDAGNHIGPFAVRDAKPATCGGPGYTGDTYCEACGEKTASGEPISNEGMEHQYDEAIDENGQQIMQVSGYIYDADRQQWYKEMQFQVVCNVCGNSMWVDAGLLEVAEDEVPLEERQKY
ncbi:MAG: S-layer homology domain-containing protein [Clostridia bacterium]|nr:S-layer homology domain-containing protein [Clostridia bacterium]